MKIKTPIYWQQAPVGMHTYAELKDMGLRPRRDELPVGLLKVQGDNYEYTGGLFQIDQTEPITPQAVPA